jgi:hypothetical protein
VDITSGIAIAGLTTALLGTLAVPGMTAHFTSKREAAARLDDRQHATYVDAITYAQLVEARLTALTEDPLYRTDQSIAQSPDALLIRAKLMLVAPADVIHAFDELTQAWEILRWNVNEDGFVGMQGDIAVFAANKRGDDVIRVATALKLFKSAVRPRDLGNLAE